MNPMDLIQQILTTGATAVVLAIPTGAIVQGVRKWIPSIDRWQVVVLAAVCAALVVGLLAWPTTIDDARLAGLVAILTWGTAIGGDAWFSKMAGKAKMPLILDSSLPREGDTVPVPHPFEEEIPTKKDIR